MPVVSITKGVVGRRHPQRRVWRVPGIPGRQGGGASAASPAQTAALGGSGETSPILPVASHDYEDAAVMLTTGINRTGEASAPNQASSRRSEPAGEFAGLEEREAGASRRDAIAD